MRSFTVAYIMAWLILGSGIRIRGSAQTNPGPVEAAGLFRAGRFTEAEHVCTRLLAQEPDNFPAALLLGRIALLANRLDEAQKWLTKAGQLKPENKEPDVLLAEVFYRRDDFPKAAALLRAMGKAVVARQLESFQDLVPYQIKGEMPAARLPFIHTDPLPLVSVRVNNSEEVYFLIDTGGSEVILDTEFASKVEAKRFGQEVRTFGGGHSAPVEFGRIDLLTLGQIEVRHVPVHIMNTQPFAAAARGKPVHGILGTVLLYHFLATLDYPGGELILEPKTKENLKRLESRALTEKHLVIPFWMAGDHFIIAWGRVSQSAPVLLFVDTGLAGGAYTGPRSVLDEAGIKVAEEKASEGVGGGGKMKLVPLEIDELSLGEAKERNLKGFFGPFPPALEYSLGFRLGGIISHQFFRPHALTLDFTGMRLFLKKGTPAR